jgi:hypothetical protein
MIGVSQMRTWLVAAMIACLAQAGAAAGAAPAFTPLAHSALITLETASTEAGLTLRLQRAQGTAPLAVTELMVAIDGRNATVTPRGDNTWSVASPGRTAARGGRLEVVVTHDGIREVLSGTLPAPGAAASGGAADAVHTNLLRDHKQLAWWILNIAVVLIAAIAISRRTS